MVMVGGEEDKRLGLSLVPVAEAQVLDTWHMDGLKGSGSQTVILDNVFVPLEHLVSDASLLSGMTGASERFSQPIFRTPMVSRAGFFSTVPILGAAQGALEQVRLSMQSRSARPGPQKEFPAKYLRLGKAHLMITSAELLLRQAGRSMLASSTLPSQDQIRLRIETRSNFAYVVFICRSAVELLDAGIGASVHRMEAPFQRFVRDIHVMASHIAFDEDQCFELAGRTLLNLPPNTPIF